MEAFCSSVDHQVKMKMELQFARGSSTTLSKTDPLFRVKITLPIKRIKHQTSLERP